MKAEKTCELCDSPRVPRERYCKAHRREKLKEMSQAGFFGPRPQPTDFGFAPSDVRHFKNWFRNRRTEEYSLPMDPHDHNTE